LFLRQFFLEPTATKPVQVGETVTLDRDESHHLFTVLRGGREAKLRLVDGRGNRFTGEAAGKAGKLALVRIHSAAVDEEERQTPRLVLYCAVMKSALKQCGRSWLPDLAPAQPLAEALASGTNAARYFGAAPYELPASQNPFWHSNLRIETLMTMGSPLAFQKVRSHFLPACSERPRLSAYNHPRDNISGVVKLFEILLIMRHWTPHSMRSFARMHMASTFRTNWYL